MAKSISDEEIQLRKRARRRLVGAIALVTVIAVFLPMVLDHEPKPVSQDVSIKIPSPDAGVFTSKIVPLAPSQKSAPPPKTEAAVPSQPAVEPPVAKADAPKVAAAPKPAAEVIVPPPNDTEASPPKKAAPAKSAEKPVAAEPVKTVEKAKAADKAKPPAKGAAGYVVQVAALNDPDKAKQMRDQIGATGVKAYTEVVPTTKGNVTRVRAGPFVSRADADSARDKLKVLGLNGNVIPK
ncbi:MAG TPA: SPOR domain-containing protein [Burkholderiales bacterium]|nr:SPOR domain-containing protein [Burkholderiales bacterium]